MKETSRWVDLIKFAQVSIIIFLIIWCYFWIFDLICMYNGISIPDSVQWDWKIFTIIGAFLLWCSVFALTVCEHEKTDLVGWMYFSLTTALWMPAAFLGILLLFVFVPQHFFTQYASPAYIAVYAIFLLFVLWILTCFYRVFRLRCISKRARIAHGIMLDMENAAANSSLRFIYIYQTTYEPSPVKDNPGSHGYFIDLCTFRRIAFWMEKTYIRAGIVCLAELQQNTFVGQYGDTYYLKLENIYNSLSIKECDCGWRYREDNNLPCVIIKRIPNFSVKNSNCVFRLQE